MHGDGAADVGGKAKGRGHEQERRRQVGVYAAVPLPELAVVKIRWIVVGRRAVDMLQNAREMEADQNRGGKGRVLAAGNCLSQGRRLFGLVIKKGLLRGRKPCCNLEIVRDVNPLSGKKLGKRTGSTGRLTSSWTRRLGQPVVTLE